MVAASLNEARTSGLNGGRELLHKWVWCFHEPKASEMQPTNAITTICMLASVITLHEILFMQHACYWYLHACWLKPACDMNVLCIVRAGLKNMHVAFMATCMFSDQWSSTCMWDACIMHVTCMQIVRKACMYPPACCM